MSSATEVFQPLQANDPATVAGYRLTARLGTGGMGVVYLSHTQGGRPVAIKVVRPQLADDPDFRRRFGREIKAARRVRGAYTAELIDADADGTPPWLATLYIPGPSLTEAVARRGRLPVPAVLWLMAGVAEALQAIHEAGIVHRDLKPSNVLLAADGPRVIDFGIAMAADGTAYTATGGTVGTPAFMAPEQATGEEITAATDIFALGQTAAFAALGKPLYGDGSAVNVLYRIVHSEPDLSQVAEPLRPLLARCLATTPAERPSPAEVLEWCREQLGADADAGAGGAPAVWREITGPEVAVPVPAPAHDTAAETVARHGATLVAPQPLTGYPPASAGWPAPPPETPLTPAERKARRRRTALIATTSMVSAALLVSALVWKVVDGSGGLGRLVVADSTQSAEGRASDPSASSSTSASGRKVGSASDDTSDSSARGNGAEDGDGGGDGTSAGEDSPTAPEKPVATPYSGVWLDAKTSVNLADPREQLKNGKGDIRFNCEKAGCELTSDTAVFFQFFADPGAGNLDSCRLMVEHSKTHTLPLAAAANGTEICVGDDAGNIGLMVIQTKSTAMPDLAFLTADLTVWRDAA